MQIIQNIDTVPSPVANFIVKSGNTLITCLFVKVAEAQDNIQDLETDISGFSFENLDALLPENKAVNTDGFPEPMRRVYHSDTLGLTSGPGYYCLMTALKFTKGDPTNKSVFDMKGPQLWAFEFKGPQIQYSRASNMNPYTAVARERGASYFLKERISSSMTLVSPFENSTLDECILVVNGACSFINVPNAVVEPWSKSFFKYLPVPTIVIANSMSADSVLSGTIEIRDYDGNLHPTQNGEVFLETTAGQLSKTRYVMGQDTMFKIRSTDLVAGDTIRIKAGWRNYSGMHEAIIQIT